jgi:hypothetical protein
LSKKVTPILSLVPLKDVDLMIPEPVEDSVVDMVRHAHHTHDTHTTHTARTMS